MASKVSDTIFDPKCPYGAEMCPKMAMTEKEIIELRKTQVEMHRILYIIVGLVTATFGVTII